MSRWISWSLMVVAFMSCRADPETLDQSGLAAAAVGVTLDISHEVLDGAGPQQLATQVEWLRENGKLYNVHVSAPHRGDVVNSWLPWQDFFMPLSSWWTGPLTIEIMNGIAPFAQPGGGGLRFVRGPFADPFAIANQAIERTKVEWNSSVNGTN